MHTFDERLAGARQSQPFRRIFDEVVQRRRERLRVFDIDVDGVLAACFAQTPASGRNQGRPRRMRLQRRQPHRLTNARRCDRNGRATRHGPDLVQRPGGVLAVEQHRSAEGLNVADVASTGYVPESYVIHEARNAGFVLEARSELNANPKDDHDHPFGVWTLPPIRQSAARNDPSGRTLTPEERAAFDAIGESDRMTLRFRKPE